MRDAEAAVATREPSPVAVAVAPAPPSPVPVKPAKPFVEQLIFQADSLQAVSRNVETQMKREGIPVLAATREFVELASRPVAPSKPPVRSTLKRTSLSPSQFDDRQDLDRDIDDLPPAVPSPRPRSGSVPPVFDIAMPVSETDLPELPVEPTPIPYDLSVAPFPGLAHHADDLPPAPIFDVPMASPLDPPAIVADHVFTDWSDAKNYHGNDHARAYDIDPALEDDVFSYEAYVPSTRRQATPTPSIPDPIVDTPAAEVASDTGRMSKVETTGIRNVAIANVLERITHHYRKRVQEAPRSSEAHADAALEPDVESVTIPRPLPGQIAHPYMVVVHDNLEIPKVPPYIWSAPELPWNCDETGHNTFDSWFNCMGNRYQLALDLEM
jgi:hypothetical protein